MLKEIIHSIQSYSKAHNFIKRHKLWVWIIIPGVVYSILFIISLYTFNQASNNLIEWLSIKTGLKAWLDEKQSGMLGLIFTLAALSLWIIQMMLYFSLFKYLWLIFGSPFFAYLSEKTESILRKEKFTFNASHFLKDILRGIKIALRNAFWQTIYMIAIIVMSLVPVLGLAIPLIAFLTESYYYGFSMLDYNCERKQMNASESIFYIGKHRGLAIGNGLVFYCMLLLPVIGWVLAPAYAVVAATLSLHETNRDNDKNKKSVYLPKTII